MTADGVGAVLPGCAIGHDAGDLGAEALEKLDQHLDAGAIPEVRK